MSRSRSRSTRTRAALCVIPSHSAMRPLRDRRAHPAQDLTLLIGDAGVDDPRETLEHGRKRRRFRGRPGARADRRSETTSRTTRSPSLNHAAAVPVAVRRCVARRSFARRCRNIATR